MALALSAAAALGCATAPASSSSNTTTTQAVTTGRTAWMSLGDGKVHEGGSPSGMHVLGSVSDGAFQPVGDVVGDGEMGASGTPGWLELKTGQFHSDVQAVAPNKPFVKGFRGEDGKFKPSTRTVTY
jgi:hypothetical protein